MLIIPGEEVVVNEKDKDHMRRRRKINQNPKSKTVTCKSPVDHIPYPPSISSKPLGELLDIAQILEASAATI